MALYNAMLAYPHIDPVALTLGPVIIRWYALAYIAGVLLGWWRAMQLARQNPLGPAPKVFEDSVPWIIGGILLGGRLGYVLFYNFAYYADHPLEALMLWHGGMAFHGGLIGVIIASYIFCRRQKVKYLEYTDVVACVAPIGLFFGRIANFINGELYGRVSDVPWAMIFPNGGDAPRHPSQLYHAGLEGITLFIILNVLAANPNIRARTGLLSGIFLIFYGLFRAFVECFREPDAQIGFLAGGITMGQLLCLPMLAAGAYLVIKAKPKA